MTPWNILWVVTTQWRAQACGYAGDPNARTPALDALAAEGLNYAEAVTPHPFGPFARAALLTGRPSPENGVADYFDGLPPDARTVAHALRERGYATAFFGKWHLNRRDPADPLVGDAAALQRVPPEGRGGFEFWEGFAGGFLLNDPWLHGTRLAVPTRVRGYQAEVLAGRAGHWCRERGEDARPWFCVLSLEPPHPPYGAPADGIPARDPAGLALPPTVPRGGTVEARARRELAGYYAHIEAVDRSIGHLLHHLGPPDPRRPVAVVVTSVHGDQHGSHGRFRKGWPYEESVRVPLLVRHPGASPGRSLAAVSLLDLAAMALAWSEGGSWLERRDRALISMPSVVPLPDQCDRIWRGVRTPGRKLILNPDGSPWMAFDLSADPAEQRNLAEDPAGAAEVAAWAANFSAARSGPD
jgi:arylsulfatase A-like enzyme